MKSFNVSAEKVIYFTEGPCLYATFGSGKKSHWPNFALAKYLPNAILGLIISLLQFSLLRSNDTLLQK